MQNSLLSKLLTSNITHFHSSYPTGCPILRQKIQRARTTLQNAHLWPAHYPSSRSRQPTQDPDGRTRYRGEQHADEYQYPSGSAVFDAVSRPVTQQYEETRIGGVHQRSVGGVYAADAATNSGKG